jgi:hypothetical protein
MLKDLVDAVEPKGTPVPLGDVGDTNRDKPKRHSLPRPADILVPSKRLKSMHRRSVANLSLKEWARGLTTKDDVDLVNQWRDSKRIKRTK